MIITAVTKQHGIYWFYMMTKKIFNGDVIRVSVFQYIASKNQSKRMYNLAYYIILDTY